MTINDLNTTVRSTNKVRSIVTIWKRQTQAPGHIVLGYFAEGVKRIGDRAIIRDPLFDCNAKAIRESDVNVVYNTFFNGSADVINKCRFAGKPIIVIEAGFIGRDLDNPWSGYWSAGYVSPKGGVKARADYCAEGAGADRWDLLREKFGVSLKHWNNGFADKPHGFATESNKSHGEANDKHILLVLQMRGDPSLEGVDSWEWARCAVKLLREHTERDIVIRPSPIDKGFPGIDGCYTSRHESIIDDLQDAWAAVTYSSNGVVEALLEGVPVFADGPSIAGDLACEDFDRIEDPYYPDSGLREQWANELAYSQWSGEECSAGKAWDRLRLCI